MRYNPLVPESDYKIIESAINSFMDKNSIKSIVDESSEEIDFSMMYYPNHAVIFNKIFDIGKKGIPIAHNTRLAYIELPSGPALYRLEDLTKS